MNQAEKPLKWKLSWSPMGQTEIWLWCGLTSSYKIHCLPGGKRDSMGPLKCGLEHMVNLKSNQRGATAIYVPSSY